MARVRYVPFVISILEIIWAGWSDEMEEGKFVSIIDSQTELVNQSKSILWEKSEPNGMRKDNCAALYNYDGLFRDAPCDVKYNAICDMTTIPIFTIRGLCKESLFDLQYSFNGQLSAGKNPRYNFVGNSKSFLLWDDIQEYWKIVKINDNSVYAINNDTENLYPFGTHPWYFFNDSCTNEKENSGENVYLSEIAITTCKEDMFNCRDGTW